MSLDAQSAPTAARAAAADRVAIDQVANAHQAPVAGSRASIALRDLSKSFGEREVLKGVCLTIEPGEFVVIVGRSGGGKSTLLRLLAGLERPDAGTIAIGSQPVTGPRGGALMMFQDARLLPWQRVIGNVGIARGPGWRQKAMEALDDVGLADRAHDWPRVLSGGQRQRVALARALVGRPEIVLLDEPFGALDLLTRTEMHELLAGVRRAHPFTAVMVTHDIGEAVALADRVLVLRAGAIALDLALPARLARRTTSDAERSALQARILEAV